ncbi:hypothetical protein [Geobacter grbiciae]|uniref:hypothetical protein n=1 Tax=Geobacter grbiciae TaxID=155042 RepID=UPI001C024063|nr:hypothetical protein [Geobacter grbiciae]MBT1075118.1 hypothetical protein [Geobacter grbiciae]
MRHFAAKPTEEERPRIVTVGMGTLGRMVVRQVRRTLRNAECILLEGREEIVHGFPTLGQKVRGADCVLIVVDPRDGEALNTANWIALKMIVERALVVILTRDPAEPAEGGMLSGDFPRAGELACSCIVVSPLSINPLSEDVLSMFGEEMLAAYLVRHVIEILVRWTTEHSIPCIDFADIKAVLGGGGMMRLGIGMSTNGDAGGAVQKAVGSLARQGVDFSPCRVRLGCLAGSTNLKMDDFDEVCKVAHEFLDDEASPIVGILTNGALGRTVKASLFVV